MSRISLLALVALFALTGLSRSQGSKDANVVLSADEKKILELTNAARQKEKLPPLLPQATLMRMAREHSRNMLKQDKMAHELDDKTPFDRLKDLGYVFSRAGENVAYGEGLPV